MRNYSAIIWVEQTDNSVWWAQVLALA